MKNTNYPSDLTDEQFARIESLLPKARPGGRHRSVDLHNIVDAILYVTGSSCPWRALPEDYPPWNTAYHYFRRWRDDGTWERVTDALRGHV